MTWATVLDLAGFFDGGDVVEADIKTSTKIFRVFSNAPYKHSVSSVSLPYGSQGGKPRPRANVKAHTAAAF
jgi:hypothetical protein